MTGRLYAIFALVAISIAIPPLVVVTLPLLVVVLTAGRRQKAAKREADRAKAYAKWERDRIRALRSLP